MSLVGTRPPTLDEWEKYELHHRARLVLYKESYHNFKSYFICAGGATIIAFIYQIFKKRKACRRYF